MNDAGQPAGTEEPAGTGRADHPSRRAPSGAWIAGSILAFVVGSLVIVYAIATTAAPTVEQRATVQGLAAAFVTGGLIAVLVPATAIVSLVIAAKRGRTGAAAGIAVCGALGAIAMLTMVPFALLSVGEAQADAARRAAPPTALETSRTPEQAEAGLVELGGRVVDALGHEAPTDDQVSVDVRPCRLDNSDDGVLVHYSWRGPDADDPAGTPEQTKAAVAPAVRFLQAEGFAVGTRFVGGGVVMLDRDQGVSVDLYSADRVELGSPCLVDTGG